MWQISALIPLYQSETAPKWIRGTIVGAYQLAITIGLLLAAIVDHSTADRMDTGSYRIPIAVQFAWAIILFFGMLLLPEVSTNVRTCFKRSIIADLEHSPDSTHVDQAWQNGQSRQVFVYIEKIRC